jgi:hypothetical protein
MLIRAQIVSNCSNAIVNTSFVNYFDQLTYYQLLKNDPAPLFYCYYTYCLAGRSLQSVR